MWKAKKEVSLVGILSATLLLNAAAACMWPLTTVYMHNQLHQTLALAGVALLGMSLCMIVGNWLGGWLFDNWSPFKSALVGTLCSFIPMLTLIVFHGWPIFGIMLLFIGLGDGIVMTVVNSFAANIKEISSRRVFNWLYIGMNLGVVVGTLMVGVLMDHGVQLVFMVASLSYAALLVIFVVDFRMDIQTKTHQHVKGPAKPAQLQLIWLIAALVFCLYLSYSLWESVISVHMTNLGISFEKYSLLWTLNGLLIVFGQPLANRIGTYFKMSSQIAVGTLIFILSFLLLVFARDYTMFVVTMVILTVGEMTGFPGIPAWIDGLAGDNDKGKFQGIYNMAISFGRAVGPLYGGLIIEYGSYQLLFWSVTGLMLAALAAVMLRNHHNLTRVKK
ncbi:MDR family MFS transporter [Levilactobacillus brevis]|jgi:predicted MFS family arabinose efflux permease|uniref:Permease of the major facilitator superfamily n=1 Tax=Levilactobacillus brevis (strain ATCC 367 / BCRC 12310 / CIP 105137 / JCM 1170 / LMG 11437 / NCIMB 947 / NCTC 947) TaxID=387344 RepID=Q03U50_LEVBA|nr:MFS transporter [Levilactobacillus brevis]MBT1152762.1 MFS transporter [Lactiplantibacillus argentoratensis]ABJ63272.1 permease of the major facilitator superfamily [Levilactobacillus brevis ATCC 367]ARQ93022.1 MFS transporter [Levilactobacillus brevis]ARW21020.1 putative MFS-type transporter YttB [Levilactobacillus brevis]KLE29239.1 MFS transporter [Levilactobacillus brevis]